MFFTGNEALVLNGYHSHMTYFDQSQPNQGQPPIPYQQPWYISRHGSGPPGGSSGSAYPNVYQPRMIQHASYQQPLYGGYHNQSWSVQQEQPFHPAVMSNQGASPAYLIGTCIAAAPGTHLLPQPQRFWPAVPRHSNAIVAANVNPKLHEATLGGKLMLQGASVDFMGNHNRGKVSANLLLNSGVAGFGSSSVHSATFQALPGAPVQHIEVRHRSKSALVLCVTFTFPTVNLIFLLNVSVATIPPTASY